MPTAKQVAAAAKARRAKAQKRAGQVRVQARRSKTQGPTVRCRRIGKRLVYEKITRVPARSLSQAVRQRCIKHAGKR